MQLEVSVDEAQRLLRDDPRATLIDVREEDEWQQARIEGARLVPLDELPQRLEELPPDRPLVVHCHHGQRSLQAARFLRERGFESACSMRGGIDAWSREADASVPRY